jgi:hypothetical protein
LEEIKAALGAATDKEHGLQIIVGGYCAALLDMMAESAAQLAEANDSLKRIANPLITVDAESPWVWLNCNGKPFVVDRNEVSGVAHLDSGIGNDMPKVQIGMKGQPWSKTADGTVEEVCKKLKIPIGG